MATVNAGDAMSAAGEGERRLDQYKSVLSSAAAEVQEGGSSGVIGREEAAHATGNAGKRRRRKRNTGRKRRRRGREEEETKGGEGKEDGEAVEEEDDDDDGDEGTSSATGSVEQDLDTGGEQEGGEQEQEVHGVEQERQNDSVEEEEEDEPFPSPETTSSSAPATAEQVSEQMLVKANLRVETGGRRTKAAIQPVEDELLLRAVVSHEAQLTDEDRPRRPVWVSIAAACGDRFASGQGATGKVLWLTRVLRDDRHEQHDKLTEPMKAMLKQYLEFMGEDDSPRAMPKKKATLSLTDPAIKRRAKWREKQRQQELAQRNEQHRTHEGRELEVESHQSIEEDADEKEEEEEEERAAESGNDLEAGVEEEPDREEPAEEVADEGGAAQAPRSSGKRTLDPTLEEKIVKAAMKYVPTLAAAKLKGAVWDDIARDSDGRYVHGGAARSHFLWLLRVMQDPNEREHRKITPALREMLQQFEDVGFRKRQAGKQREGSAKSSGQKLLRLPGRTVAKAKKQIEDDAGGVQNRKRRQRSHTTGEGSDREEKAAGNEIPPLPKSKTKVALDAALEEKLVAAVMNHISAFEAATSKGVVWDDVARDSRGRYKNGISARSHYLWLLRVMKNPHEREHAKLSPKLREMLRELDRVGFNPKKPAETKETDDAAARITASRRPKTTDSTADHPTKNVAVQSTAHTSKAKGVRPSKLTVDPAMDEALMKMQLKFRPFDVHPLNERPTIWKRIVQELNEPRLPNSTIASKRCFWLRFVLVNIDHEQHKNLTPRLRKLVADYMDALEKSPYNKNAPQRSSPSSRGEQQAVDSDTASSVSEPVTRSRRRIHDEPVTAGPKKRARTASARDEADVVSVAQGTVAEEDAATTPVPTAFEDHALLLEILRDPPFLAKKKGGCNPRWELVAQAVQKHMGPKAVLTSGEACMRRMVKLLSAVRNPDGRSSVTVPIEQFEMLSLINTLTGFKTAWVSFEKNETELYQSLKEQIATILSKPTPTSEPLHKIASSGPTTLLPDDEVAEAAGEEAAKADEVEEDDEPVREEVVQRPDERESRRHKRQRTEESLSPLHGPVDSLFTFDRPTIVELLQQREPVALGENGSISAKLKSLQENVATCRAEITVQSSRLEKGRRHHREELLAMFELLKQEHETHTAQAAEMLERIEKERLERRDEFANMMNLVSQMLPPL